MEQHIFNSIEETQAYLNAQDTVGSQDTQGVRDGGAEGEQPEQPSVFRSAKDYINKGWSVIPIQKGTKQPAVSEWTPYQDKLPNPSELERWFKDSDHQIALVTGYVSGGLFILDFDGKQWDLAFEEFCRAFPEFELTP